MDIVASLSSVILALPGGAVLWPILMFVVVLSVLVFFHELGHYLAARSVGVKVESFSIGFGPELWGWNDKHGTRWKICAAPLGGYVEMYGDQPHEKVPAKLKDQAFLMKSVGQRMWVVFAGPLANFILAVVFMMCLTIHGEQMVSPVIGAIVEDSAASDAGFQPGDRIIKFGSVEPVEWEDVRTAIQLTEGRQAQAYIEREGQQIMLTVQPRIQEHVNRFGEKVVIPYLGVAPSNEVFYLERSLGDAIVAGFTRTWDYTVLMLQGVWKLLTGAVPADRIGGPVMIAEVAGSAAEQGTYELVIIMVLISLNLGLINLFPIPVLDGGHLLFYAIEAIKGSPLSEKAQEWGGRFGMAMIAALMVLAFHNDISRIVDRVTGEKLVEQVSKEGQPSTQE